jgi:hypothetical protein
MSNNKQSSVDKEFVPYEQALALKELGFNEPCLASYFHASKRLDIAVEYVRHGEYTVLAPTFSQAFRWFREKHKLHCHIEYIPAGDVYEWWIKHDRANYPTYEEAELACLKKLIEIVKLDKNDK